MAEVAKIHQIPDAQLNELILFYDEVNSNLDDAPFAYVIIAALTDKFPELFPKQILIHRGRHEHPEIESLIKRIARLRNESSIHELHQLPNEKIDSIISELLSRQANATDLAVAVDVIAKLKSEFPHLFSQQESLMKHHQQTRELVIQIYSRIAERRPRQAE